MRNKLFTILTLAAALMAFSVSAFAQGTAPTFTTLSAAVSDARTTRLVVASATGFVASNSTTGLDYGMFVDNEFMRITGVTSTTITVQRGQSNTTATPHISGAYVIVGQFGSQAQSGTQTGGPFVQNGLYGTCSRSAYPYLPVTQVNANAIGGQAMYDCINGTWSKQGLLGGGGAGGGFGSLAKFCSVPIGSVAYGSFGTSTTASTTSEYLVSVYVPNTFVATGITQLNGSAVDTGSKKIVILRSSDTSGAKLAWSALAGTAASGNDAFQAIPFTATRIVTGPSFYLLAMQDDTADANGIRTIATATFNNVIAGVTTSVFGTIASTITVPTTFTADQGPIACLY